MTDFAKARKNMIDGQIHTNGVTDPRILDALDIVPRELFVPEKKQDIAYIDENIDMGQGRFLMEPTAYGKLLQAANIKETDLVLDVASGSGYGAALLSYIASTVIALDNKKRLIDKAQRNWEKLGICNIVQKDDSIEKGIESEAPFSLIFINGALSQVPQCFFDQLDIGGRLLTVLKKPNECMGKAVIYTKAASGQVSERILFDVGVPALPEFEEATAFQF